MSKTLSDPTKSDHVSKVLKPVHPDVEGYVDGLLKRHDEEVLLEMEEKARQGNFPIVGRQVGVFLEVLARGIGAKRVFEFGSGYGYSAYWFSKAVGSNGSVICTDGDQSNLDQAKAYLERVGRADLVEFHHGIAQDTFKKTQGEFDIIYNDVDKGDYPEIWDMSKDRIRPGGLYIADNILWSGRVTVDGPVEDVMPGWTEAIDKHNKAIANDSDFETFVNPTRDGVIVAIKK